MRIDSANAVQLQNVRIANFGQNGIDFTPTATNDTSLSLDDVTIAEIFGNGLVVGANNPTQKLDVVVRNSLIQGARGTFGTVGERGIGVSADTGAHVWLIGTTIFDNLLGVKTFNRAAGTAGIVDDACGNLIAGNDEPGTVPNDLCTPPPAPIVVTPPRAARRHQHRRGAREVQRPRRPRADDEHRRAPAEGRRLRARHRQQEGDEEAEPGRHGDGPEDEGRHEARQGDEGRGDGRRGGEGRPPRTLS